MGSTPKEEFDTIGANSFLLEMTPIYIGYRRRKRGRGGGAAPPNNLRGGANIPFGPPNNPPTCTGKTIPLNSILEFSIISYFKGLLHCFSTCIEITGTHWY